MGKHLVLVGGGHAHLTILKNLNTFVSQGHNVTVINSDKLHYYSGMGPGMMSGLYTPEMICFNVKKMVEKRGGSFIVDKVVKADPIKKMVYTKAGHEINYDVVSFNTGSLVPLECNEKYINDFVFPVKPIENLLTARNKIIKDLKNKTLNICIAGGGAAGVEIAANLRRLVKESKGKANIYLIAGRQILPNFNPKLRNAVLRAFKRLDINVMEGVRLRHINEKNVELSNSSDLNADFIFAAVGTTPSPLFDISNIPTGHDKGLLVDEYLCSVSFPEIFGGGDCISFAPKSLARVGVYAVRQNPVLYHNINTALNNSTDFRRFIPQKSFMLILNMGDGTGIFFRNSIVWKSKLAFMLKDYIDKKFMKEFQV